MDIFLTANLDRDKCSCQPWNVQISDVCLGMKPGCHIHENSCWESLSGYIMDSIMLIRITCTPQRSSGFNRVIDFDTGNFSIAYVPETGEVELALDEGRHCIGSGMIGVFHSSLAGRAVVSDNFSGAVLVIPHSELSVEQFQNGDTRSCVLDAGSGPGRLAAQMAVTMPDVLVSETCMSRRRELAQHLLGLLRMSLLAELELGSQVTARQQIHLQRIFVMIDTMLDDPDLDLESIADKVHLSSTYVSRLLSVHGSSFRDELRSRRLSRVASALADPARRSTSVTLLALESGFCNSSAFSRVFCQKYGLSPREYRKQFMSSRSLIGATASH